MSSPFTTTDLTHEEQVENVRAALTSARMTLDQYGMTEAQATSLVAFNPGRKLRTPRYYAALAFVQTRAQMEEMSHECLRGEK